MAARAAAAPTRAVFRSADDLFAQLTLRDVARVLDKTRLDAEKKRAELRELGECLLRSVPGVNAGGARSGASIP